MGEFHVPGSSTISKRQVQVDAALCCFWRRRLVHEDNSLFLWADSSPQAGSDWLMSLMLIIKSTELWQCLQSSFAIALSVIDFMEAHSQDDTDRLEALALQRHEQGVYLTQALQLHRQVPTALGSGCTSLEHKCKCIVHKCFLETQSEPALIKVMSNIVAMCTDQGTEASISDFAGASASEFLQPWAREVPGIEADSGFG